MFVPTHSVLKNLIGFIILQDMVYHAENLHYQKLNVLCAKRYSHMQHISEDTCLCAAKSWYVLLMVLLSQDRHLNNFMESATMVNQSRRDITSVSNTTGIDGEL